MTQEFVSYEQALALEELGFTFYDSDLDMKCYAQAWDFSLSYKKNVPIPLKQQVFRWFRKKYEIDNAVLKDRFVIETQEDLPTWYYGFKTYEEAEDACIDKLISLIKNK